MARFPADRNKGDETSREAWLLVSSQGVNADTGTEAEDTGESAFLYTRCTDGQSCFVLIPGCLPTFSPCWPATCYGN